MFNNPTNGRTKRTIQLKRIWQSGRMQDGAALLAGTFEVQHLNQTEIRVRAKLSLNPTRAVRYQPRNPDLVRSYISGQRDPSTIGSIALWSRSIPVPFRATPIEPFADNVLIDRIDRAIGSQPYWTEFLSSYVISCGAFVRAVIGRIRQEALYRNQTLLDVGFINHQALRTVETYWEFTARDPIATLRGLESQVRALGRDTRYREYENVASERRNLGHAPLFSIGLGDSARAVLYPKTTNTIRLEIRHLVGKMSGISSEVGSDEEIVEKILSLTQTATSHANVILGAITEGMDHPEPAPAYELVAHIYEVFQSERRLQHRRRQAAENPSSINVSLQPTPAYILSTIANERGFVCGFNDPARPYLLRLNKRGVVRRLRPNSHTFILTERYRSAAELLTRNISSVFGDLE